MNAAVEAPTVYLSGDQHRIPFVLTGEPHHHRSRECWCRPDYVVGVGGDATVIHRRPA